jgi:phosphate transport system protein
MASVQTMGTRVLETVERSIWALDGTNEPLARQTMVAARRIDRDRAAIRMLCIRMLQRGGLDEPSTRLVMAACTIASDLAQTGAHAIEICKLVVATEEQGIACDGAEIDHFGGLALAMFREALAAFRAVDRAAALHVIEQDRDVEDRNLAILLGMSARLSRGVGRPETYLPELRVAKHLEGVAKHARNVAEQVAVLTDGLHF